MTYRIFGKSFSLRFRLREVFLRISQLGFSIRMDLEVGTGIMLGHI
jgi:hypothetical protein